MTSHILHDIISTYPQQLHWDRELNMFYGFISTNTINVCLNQTVNTNIQHSSLDRPGCNAALIFAEMLLVAHETCWVLSLLFLVCLPESFKETCSFATMQMTENPAWEQPCSTVYGAVFVLKSNIPLLFLVVIIVSGDKCHVLQAQDPFIGLQKKSGQVRWLEDFHCTFFLTCLNT